mgnify:CR=1 FL=1
MMGKVNRAIIKRQYFNNGIVAANTIPPSLILEEKTVAFRIIFYYYSVIGY